MVALLSAIRGEFIDHRGRYPPWQPPTTHWLATNENRCVRLAAHSLNIPPRIALPRWLVLGLMYEMADLPLIAAPR
jgi:hypothetical protein